MGALGLWHAWRLRRLTPAPHTTPLSRRPQPSPGSLLQARHLGTVRKKAPRPGCCPPPPAGMASMQGHAIERHAHEWSQAGSALEAEQRGDALPHPPIRAVAPLAPRGPAGRGEEGPSAGGGAEAVSTAMRVCSPAKISSSRADWKGVRGVQVHRGRRERAQRGRPVPLSHCTETSQAKPGNLYPSPLSTLRSAARLVWTVGQAGLEDFPQRFGHLVLRRAGRQGEGLVPERWCMAAC